MAMVSLLNQGCRFWRIIRAWIGAAQHLGAAVALAPLTCWPAQYAGVGNIAGAVSPAGAHQMVSTTGRWHGEVPQAGVHLSLEQDSLPR